MEQSLREFFTNGATVAEFHAIVSRERLPNGVERISIKELDTGAELWSFWQNPNVVKAADPEHPKGVGGKKPFVMLMVEEVESLCACDDKGERKVKNAEEIIGWLARLARYIEWRTGKLIYKRKRKRRQDGTFKEQELGYNDLLRIYHCSRNKLDKMLSQLRKLGFLTHTGEGYFVSKRLIKKGKTGGSNAKESVSDEGSGSCMVPRLAADSRSG